MRGDVAEGACNDAFSRMYASWLMAATIYLSVCGWKAGFGNLQKYHTDKGR